MSNNVFTLLYSVVYKLYNLIIYRNNVQYFSSIFALETLMLLTMLLFFNMKELDRSENKVTKKMI